MTQDDSMHRAELEYASHSPLGVSGGSLVPASCESNYPHTSEECWNTYCTGAEGGANDWQWWQYRDGQAGREYRFLRAGDGSCMPPPGEPTNGSASCSSNTATINWSVPSSATYTKFVLHDAQTSYQWPEENIYGTQKTVSGLYGGDYRWSVAACNAAGCSNYVAGPAFSCAPPPPTPAAPIGYHDGISCSQVWGWTCDPNNYNTPLSVHVYRDGPAGGGGIYVGQSVANLHRGDLAGVCGGNAYHAYSVPIALPDTASHSFYVYAIDEGSHGNAGNPLLGGSPQAISCPVAAVPTNVRATCNAGNTSATAYWDAVPGATTYHPRIRDYTKAACDSIGWQWVDGAPVGDGIGTCYTNNWPYGTSVANLPISPDKNYDFWVHSDPPYNPTAGIVTFRCNSPSTPTNLQASCVGTAANVSWSAGSNNSSYALRINDTSNPWVGSCAATQNSGDVCLDYYTSTSYPFTGVVGRTYRTWVHGINNGVLSAATPGKDFTCANPPSPSPTATLEIKPRASSTWSTSAQIAQGQHVDLRWSSTNASTCSGLNFSTGGATSGTTNSDAAVSEPSVGAISYTVSCNNGGSPVTDSVSLNVQLPMPPPTMSVSPAVVDKNGSTVVSGNLNGHTGCVIAGENISGTADSVAVSGTTYSRTTGPVLGETTYSMTCTTWGGSPVTGTVSIKPIFTEE
ncbi:hypothetical protein K2X96_02415 [Patescibacteria group bacterium]|nr:hypothetical protein [Patescibacteria group bacterium]